MPGMHSVYSEVPFDGQKLPAGHGIHFDEPGDEAYSPSGQVWHVKFEVAM